MPRTRSSHKFAERSDASYGIRSGTTSIELPVSLIDSEVRTSAPQMFTNFGIGTLATASVQIAAHGLDDPILHRRFKIGVHRQTEYLVGQTVAHRHVTIGYREVLVSRLAMQRL